ncbi:MAG: hypothetical protein KF894_22395 [Labilithrix sp.]|nr:hypothetical protein [Labilithrix sp.]
MRRAPGLVLVSLLTSSCLSVCGGIEPHSPASNLEEDPKIPLNTCRSFAMHYYVGGPGGMQYLTELTARCADPTICAAAVESPRIGNETKPPAHVYLAGIRTGKTKVLVDFVDPSTQKPTSKAIDVELTGALPERPIEVGVETPRDVLVVIRDRSGEPFQCEARAASGFALLRAALDPRTSKGDARPAAPEPATTSTAAGASPELAPPTAADHEEMGEEAAVFGCSARREIAPGLKHFCAGDATEDQDLWVCVSRTEDRFYAPVRGLVLYRRGPDGRLRADEVRGEPDRARCP